MTGSSLGLVILVGLATASCGVAAVEPPPRLGCAAPTVREDSEIQEAVLRDLLEGFITSPDRRWADVVFLGVVSQEVVH